MRIVLQHKCVRDVSCMFNDNQALEALSTRYRRCCRQHRYVKEDRSWVTKIGCEGGKTTIRGSSAFLCEPLSVIYAGDGAGTAIVGAYIPASITSTRTRAWLQLYSWSNVALRCATLCTQCAYRISQKFRFQF